ncbi:MAG: DUF4476 domain-containing protein [Ferruginibacter sp.]
MQSGTFNISVGFPKNEWPAQAMSIKIENNDLGFILKNFGDKGWGLFNLQTLNITMNSAVANAAVDVPKNKTDEFSNVLADVVNTPALKQEKSAPPIPETKLIEPINPVAVQKNQDISIRTITSTLDPAGRSTVYLSRENSEYDTVRIFIPYENPAVPAPLKENLNEEKKEEVKSEKKFLNIELPNPNLQNDTTVVPKSTDITKNEASILVEGNLSRSPAEPLKPDVNTLNKKTSINSDCKSQATDTDFLKLRKKMVSESKEDKMLSVARKAFKSDCYSTLQIKNLGTLFLNDEGRYKFFDVAYPFVYDSQNFSDLQTLLSDEYLINRFKTLIRH